MRFILTQIGPISSQYCNSLILYYLDNKAEGNYEALANLFPSEIRRFIIVVLFFNKP